MKNFNFKFLMMILLKIFVTILISCVILYFQKHNIKPYLEKLNIIYFRDTIGHKLTKINLELTGL